MKYVKKDQELGFEYKVDMVDGVEAASVTNVIQGSDVEKKGLRIGWSIARINGMDASMFSKSQIQEQLDDVSKRSTLAVRFKP